MVCEKVFLGGGWGRGLLDSKHSSPGLRKAVAQCANPTGGKQVLLLLSLPLFMLMLMLLLFEAFTHGCIFMQTFKVQGKINAL